MRADPRMVQGSYNVVFSPYDSLENHFCLLHRRPILCYTPHPEDWKALVQIH